MRTKYPQYYWVVLNNFGVLQKDLKKLETAINTFEKTLKIIE